MPLQTGTRLGPYEVTAFIGAGGMGEVYRARDGRLNRDVAIKVLPEGVARDEESRNRFERETQAVAALSHPNVLAIFDTGSHEGRLFAVTELLDGQTLRERLREGPLPVRKAVDWAVQIARGLAAAHDKQLVHRDIKPENVFLTKDGRIKILDFGLAKAPRETDAAAATVADATGAGVVLGTAGYMAPEQVRGQAMDARTDLFAFGAVLYELLTGVRAFRRDTVAETMTAILHDDPPDLGARPDMPPSLERIVRHCLEKQPQERFQTARDVAFALETLSAATSAPTGAAGTAATTPARPPIARLAIGAGVIGAAIASGWFLASWTGLLSSRATPAIALGAATQVTADDGLEIDAALSPDGKTLAYTAGKATQMRIYIRPVAGGRTLTLSEGGAAFEYQPRWSPDGSQILFMRPDGVFVASSFGGTSRRVAAGNFAGAAWLPNGEQVLLVRTNSLSVMPLAGGAEVTLATGGSDLHSCAWSPSNAWVACVSGNSQAVVPGQQFGNVAPSALVLVPATGGPLVKVAASTVAHLSPSWSPDGGFLYFVSNREGPRDIYALEVGARGVQGDVRRVTTGLGVQSIAFAASGDRLSYVTYVARANLWSVPIPAGAAVDTTGAQSLTNSNQVIESVVVSKDGKWLIFDSTLHLNAEILRMPVGGGAIDRLTNEPADDFAPDPSSDGRFLAFHSWRSGSRDIYVQPIDGGPAEAVTATPSQESYPKWSPHGKALAFVIQVEPRDGIVHGRLHVVRRQENGGWGKPVQVQQDLVANQGAWLPGPNGGLLAYARDGRIELIDPNGGSSQLVYAPSAPTDPRAWSVVSSEDGRTLYFKSGDADDRSTIWSVPAAGGKPRLLARFGDWSRPSIRPDFAAGGGRLFFTLEDRQADIWVAEVSKR